MAYKVALQQFEGPLDLLLHLIQNAEVDIREIFVSEITSQYLEYVNSAEDLDMDTASEFITMAATLLYIKSRSLLPRPPKETDDPEEDPEVALIRRLREYKAYKEASAKLDELRVFAGESYSKLPDEYILPEQVTEFTGGTVDRLFSAFCEILKGASNDNISQKDLSHEVAADTYTVRGCMNDIRATLTDSPSIDFFELFGSNDTKLKIIVMFMALLEMIMRGEVTIQQEFPYAKITVSALELRAGDDDVDPYASNIDETSETDYEG